MKKLITKHKMTQKIFLSIIIVLLLSFAVPAKSQAGFFGLLFDPLFDLVGSGVDVVVAALQAFLVDGEFSNVERGETSGLNAYLVDKGKFMEKAKPGEAYEEFAYHTENGEAEVKVYEDELDNFFGISTYAIPVMRYTPEKIFSGRVPALDINFINPKDWEAEGYENGSEMNDRSITREIHETIATWYVSLRNLAVVGLMLVLVYVGIRMVISSTASDKAKYKQMLMDWLVALCILFCLHYIMTFTTAIVNQITQSITGASENNGNNIAVKVVDQNGNDTGTEFNTDLMGLMRFKMQHPDAPMKLLYFILYLAMVIYTCMFTFYYLKRVLTMAFLTLISPLVALTYPIDKIRDGKAQAFDMWLKEYVFNALLQPFHLIIYTIFVSSAIDLAAKNPLIAIVALAFITPAEKILRKFFGFEKASTASALGAAASAVGGAAAYKALGNAINRGAKGSKGGNNNVRTKDKGRIEDPNSPSGVDGFTEVVSRQSSADNQQISNNQQELTPEAQAWEEYARTGNVLGEDSELSNLQNESAQQRINDNTTMTQINDLESEAQAWESLATAENAGGASSQNTFSQPTTVRTQPERETITPQTQAPLINSDERKVDKEDRVLRGLRGGFAGAGRAISNKATTTLGNKQWRSNTGKAALRTAGHAALRVGAAAAVGALGVAAGIAGDEPEDIFKYGLGGAVLGGTVGGNMAINAAEGMASSAPVQGFIEGFTGKNSTQRTLERQKNEMINDVNFERNIQQTYQPGRKELSGKELRQATERAADLVNAGIDPSKLAKALKTEDTIKADLDDKLSEAQKDDFARKRTITAMKMADSIKDPNKLKNDKYVEEQIKNITKGIMKENSSLTEKQAEKNAIEMMKIVKKIHKIN